MTCITLMRYQQKQQKDYQTDQKKVEIGDDDMKEIDQMLNQWITNSIIRKELRKLIVKEIKKNK